MKLHRLILRFTFIILLIFFCKDENTTNINRYQLICKKVADCDRNFKNISDIESHCINLFLKLEKNKIDLLKNIVECINTAPCESLSFQECTIEYIKELQSMKPNLNY